MKRNLVKQNERLEELFVKDLKIIQNPSEYLFTSDAVALAKFAKCKKGSCVVDLCSGSGVIGLLMYGEYEPKVVHMVELQPVLADMSRRSVEYNNLQDKIFVHNTKLQGVSSTIGCGIADIVVCNPPYKAANNKMGDKHSINIAKFEIELTFEDVVKESVKLLRFGGKLCVVNKIERLTDIIVAMRENKIEPKRIKFLSNSVLVEGVLGGKNGVKVEK